MGKIFYVMGKSSSGKDTIYNQIMKNKELCLNPIVLYTTRPIRDGETEGVEYHFVDDVAFKSFLDEGKIIEERVYHTVHGDWRYFTVDDGSVDVSNQSYIVIGTLESFVAFKNYYKKDVVVPIYIEIKDDGDRLIRAIKREQSQKEPKYKELCRRFLADAEDFSEENIAKAEILDANRFENDDLNECISKIVEYINGF